MKQSFIRFWLFAALFALPLAGCAFAGANSAPSFPAYSASPLIEPSSRAKGTSSDSPEALKEELVIPAKEGNPLVYMTAEIRPEGLERANTALHLQIAEDHGFADIAPVDILDAAGEMALPVKGGAHLTENRVGAGLADYDFCIVLSHFKGQSTGGYSGVIRNASIGFASVPGKCLIHTAGADDASWRGGEAAAFLESTAEAAKSIADYFDHGENIVYIHVLNHLSVDCDCRSHPAEPDMHDIGILASADPVALEQASVDLVFSAPDRETLSRRIKEGEGLHSLEYGEQIGLGSRSYRLVSLDEKEGSS
ncbi:MAG: DUF362 domain-containing protein [Provencibacterium sp.]|jgi:uncharacterized Fe-S center protein|nr:DUF362 domain-containing protein [Provencibacterium sp.]